LQVLGLPGSDDSTPRRPELRAGSGRALAVACHVFGEELQRDETMETSVFGLRDNAHAAANFPDEAVMRDSLADGWRRVRH
jgi:hypothetical protein